MQFGIDKVFRLQNWFANCQEREGFIVTVPNLKILDKPRQSTEYIRAKRAAGKPVITAEYARQRLKYTPETGQLTARLSVGGLRAGEQVGTISTGGYRQVYLNYWSFRSSRLIYLMMKGEWPPDGYYMDHKNGIRDDDRWCNLRLATPAENARNRKPCRRNTTGRIGVHPIIGTALFGAEIGVNGKGIKLGKFECVDDAIDARCTAERHYFGEFARGAK